MKTKLLAVLAIVVIVVGLVSAVGMASMNGRPQLDTASSKDDSSHGKHDDIDEHNETRPENPSENKMSALAFHDTWRKLWEDHITWTRMVIIGVLDDMPGTGNYTARLLQNYEDMEDNLRPFYGNSADQLGDLIQEHLVIAAQILSALKAGNDTSALLAQWYANGHDIAVKMSEMNPKYWPLSMGDPMWKAHLDATVQEVLAHFNKDWMGDVAAYDAVHVQALGMADFFSNGVIKQFPQMFTGNGLVVSP